MFPFDWKKYFKIYRFFPPTAIPTLNPPKLSHKLKHDICVIVWASIRVCFKSRLSIWFTKNSHSNTLRKVSFSKVVYTYVGVQKAGHFSYSRFILFSQSYRIMVENDSNSSSDCDNSSDTIGFRYTCIYIRPKWDTSYIWRKMYHNLNCIQRRKI